MLRTLLAFGVVMLFCGSCMADEKELTLLINLKAGSNGLRNAPVSATVNLPKLDEDQYLLTRLECRGASVPARGLLRAGIVTEAAAKADNATMPYEIHWLVPSLTAGEEMEFKATLIKVSATRLKSGVKTFSWKKGAHHTDLVYGPMDYDDQRPILRYMHKAYDDKSPEARNQSYKVFHHLFDLAGKRFVTNGGHTDPYEDEKRLLYPHHRGLQFGFNKCVYDDGKKRADTWHCQKDDHQSHEGILRSEAGTFLGRHRVAIAWHGDGKKVFVKEERELTVYNVAGGTLVEFASRLKPVGGPVKLDGDPQHAGFQFRASNDVATKTAKQTYYLRPDGKGEPGATRNWDPKTKEGPTNLPWNAMSFVLDDKRYTVCYFDHPANPGEKRWSERDYGRFGCYFEHELTEDRPLVVHYRIWLQEGEMTADQVEALSRQFVAPPKVSVK